MTISDIQTKARSLVSADTTSWTAANMLIDNNIAYEDVVTEILKNDRTWEFDDQNYTTSPILTTTLVDGQNDYSFSTAFLNVIVVEIQDINGDWVRLAPLDITQTTLPLDELFPDDDIPLYYDLRYGSIWLYPAPDTAKVTASGGLRIYAQRNADNFTSAQVTTGTKVPGFAVHHEIIAYKSAIDYAMAYKKDRVPYLISKSNELMEKILEHYATREKGVRRRLKFDNRNYH